MTSSPPPSPLEAIFSEQGRLRRFLEFEAALAMAEAELGIIPREAADDIIRIATADTVDLAVLRSETERTGYPIAPLVRQLVAACDGDHGQYVHWGSTTQDVMDTALALQMRQGLDAIEADLKAIAAVLVDIADTHRQTLMVARTFGGHAPEEAARDRAELNELFASGTLRPHIGATFPLDRTADALRFVADRKATGKVLIVP